jgi:hypothetical protein
MWSIGCKFMFSSNLLCVLVMLIVPLTAFSKWPGDDLPPGRLQAKAKTACLECHDSRVIVQQRLGRAAWTKEVEKMIKWGAVVDASDRDALIEYLSINFPTDKEQELAPRTARSKKK